MLQYGAACCRSCVADCDCFWSMQGQAGRDGGREGGLEGLTLLRSLGQRSRPLCRQLDACCLSSPVPCFLIQCYALPSCPVQVTAPCDAGISSYTNLHAQPSRRVTHCGPCPECGFPGCPALSFCVGATPGWGLQYSVQARPKPQDRATVRTDCQKASAAFGSLLLAARGTPICRSLPVWALGGPEAAAAERPSLLRPQTTAISVRNEHHGGLRSGLAS